jgi:hypothetical protein
MKLSTLRRIIREEVRKLKEDYWTGDDDRSMFADPGGRSALRRATRRNPRIYPCPTCKAPNRLTYKDVKLGYQCDRCADREEGVW